MGLEETYINILKAIYDKPTANIILNGVKLKAFRWVNYMPTLTSFIQQSAGSPSHSNQTRKRNKSKFGKEEVELSLFA